MTHCTTGTALGRPAGLCEVEAVAVLAFAVPVAAVVLVLDGGTEDEEEDGVAYGSTQLG